MAFNNRIKVKFLTVPMCTNTLYKYLIRPCIKFDITKFLAQFKMFKFNFLKDDNMRHDENTDEHIWYHAKEVLNVTQDTESILQLNTTKTLQFGALEIKHVNADLQMILSHNPRMNCIVQAENKHSDLLTAVYEGGLKIWECTIDLGNYLFEQKLDFKDKVVLDLGCGAGIIGILCVLNGAKAFFQDYNEEVIKYLTIPNVYLNDGPKNILQHCKFYSGDWGSFLELIQNEKFDYIFTSETIYNFSNYGKLYKIFKKCLKPNGVVYVAAKNHYFGVGGGIRHFEKYLQCENFFDTCVCWKCSGGLQREILRVNLKKTVL